MKQNAYKIIVALLLFSVSAKAWEFGGHIGDNVHLKYLTMHAGQPISRIFSIEADLGGLNNKNYMVAGSYALYGELGIGLRVEFSHFYLKLVPAVAGLSDKTFHGLPSYYQFPTTLYMGLQNDVAQLGLFAKHISNGSGNGKNTGADLVGLEFNMILN